MNDGDNNIKKGLLKSTSIIGGTQVFVILTGLVKTKVIAILLGPTGIGLMGLFQSIIDMVRNATGLGINYSGVKDVAEAHDTGDSARISIAIFTLRRWAIFTGLLGVLVTVLLCVPLSNYSFDSPQYALSIAISSLSILFTSVNLGQVALLQGLRMIKKMAKVSALSAIVGTLIVIPIYWKFGIKGIVPAIVISALGSLVVSWFNVHKIEIKKPDLSLIRTFYEGLSMVKLGFFMVISSFLSVATMYIVRSYINKQMGADAVGYFQSVFSITNVYLSVVLNAMLADFFPRLCAAKIDKKSSTSLVNQQLELALLIGSIMVVVIMVLARFILSILYSSDFVYATSLLQWHMIGVLLTFMVWPLGVLFLAYGDGKFSVITDAFWSIVYFLLIYFGWRRYGFEILGIAYVFATAAKFVLVFLITRRYYDFTFSSINTKYILLFAFLSLLLFVVVRTFHGVIKGVLVSVIICIVFGYSLYSMNKIVSIAHIIKKILKRNA